MPPLAARITHTFGLSYPDARGAERRLGSDVASRV